MNICPFCQSPTEEVHCEIRCTACHRVLEDCGDSGMAENDPCCGGACVACDDPDPWAGIWI